MTDNGARKPGAADGSSDNDLVNSLRKASAGDVVWTDEVSVGSVAPKPSMANVEDATTSAVVQLERRLRDRYEQPSVSQDDSVSRDEPAAVSRGEVVNHQTPRKVRVDAERIESYLNLIGELVVIKSQLIQDPSMQQLKNQRLNSLMMLLDKTVRELQEASVSMRMTSLRSTFTKLRNTVHDVCSRLHKSVHLDIHGEDTELDRTIVEILGDPLMHLCRNAIDHGVETAEERRATGKPEIGRIAITAGHQGGRIFIEIRDDGRGIRAERVFEKAKKLKLIDEDSILDGYSMDRLLEFLFVPGFTTAQETSDISGRGVGLDAVKSIIEQVKGRVTVSTKPGEGTVFRLWIPLTTAITDGMLIRVGGNTFVLPIEVIRELIQVSAAQVSEGDDGHLVINNRGLLIPLLDLETTLGSVTVRVGKQIRTLQERLEGAVVVIAEARSRQVALLVDQVLGQSQVVVKGLGSAVSDSLGVAGAAILGDGRVGLIIDVADILDSHSASRVVEKREAA